MNLTQRVPRQCLAINKSCSADQLRCLLYISTGGEWTEFISDLCQHTLLGHITCKSMRLQPVRHNPLSIFYLILNNLTKKSIVHIRLGRVTRRLIFGIRALIIVGFCHLYHELKQVASPLDLVNRYILVTTRSVDPSNRPV